MEKFPGVPLRSSLMGSIPAGVFGTSVLFFFIQEKLDFFHLKVVIC